MIFPNSRRILTVLLCAVAVLGAAQVRAHGVTLVVHHYLPESSPFHTQFLLPWTQKLEKESSGLLRFRYAGASEPAKLAERVTDRTVDIAFTLTRFTPARFPAMEAFERAAIQHSAQGASRAAWEYFRLNDLADKDFDEIRLVAVAIAPAADGTQAVGVLVMNGRSYKALTDPLKKVINDNSGAEVSAAVAASLVSDKSTFASPRGDSLDAWIQEAAQRGLNAKALAESARSLMAEYDTPRK